MRAALIRLFIAEAHAHSWLDCLDYDCPDAAPGAGPQAPGACTCKGYARNWANVMAGQAFAADMGRDNRPGAAPTAGGLVCDAGKEPNPGAGTDIPGGLYSAQYPAATLASGQAVRSRWPAKNHANTPSAGTVVRCAHALNPILRIPETSPTTAVTVRAPPPALPETAPLSTPTRCGLPWNRRCTSLRRPTRATPSARPPPSRGK